MASGRKLYVFKLSNGDWKYTIDFPGYPIDIALEDSTRAYILLDSRILVLFDYDRNEVLEASKVPGATETKLTAGDARISWDATFKRLLIQRRCPIILMAVRTMWCVVSSRDKPVRITMPIPLKKPRQRRIVPVLVQVVGDMNEGVGGYLVQAKVYGSGSLIGLPITNHKGDGILQIACEGHKLFSSSSPADWETTGSPFAGSPEGSASHAGLVEIYASVTVRQTRSG